jgi:hypothetical protein
MNSFSVSIPEAIFIASTMDVKPNGNSFLSERPTELLSGSGGTARLFSF